MQRDLSKLQIRSEVQFVLQSINSYEDVPKDKLQEYLLQLASITNREDVLNLLLKELPRAKDEKARLISYFLIELGELEQLKDKLWQMITAPNYSDEIKDIVSITLKSLGDDSSPEVFLEHLEDPKAIIEKETNRLLDVALLNPEAQIDFIDFLLSLPYEDRDSLLKSLKLDYFGDSLASILVPALEYNISEEMNRAIIEYLGDTKSAMAIKPLQDIIYYSKDQISIKLAQKSLNLLKLSGVKENHPDNFSREEAICNRSQIFECYSSSIDGMGNQGVIISRLKENNDIAMFSVVINDVEGIVDCFGFNGISKDDFYSIICKFDKNNIGVAVPPEYCKKILQDSECLNKRHGIGVPYEYTCWKALINDFPDLDTPLEKLAEKWADKVHLERQLVLLKHESFQHWFLEDADNSFMAEIMGQVLKDAAKNKDRYIDSPDEFLEKLEAKIPEILESFFNSFIYDLYSKRFINAAYLLDLREETTFRNIAATMGIYFAKSPIRDSEFFKVFLKRTILHTFLRHQNKFLEVKSVKVTVFNKNKLNTNTSKENIAQKDLTDIIKILKNNWKNI